MYSEKHCYVGQELLLSAVKPLLGNQISKRRLLEKSLRERRLWWTECQVNHTAVHKIHENARHGSLLCYTSSACNCHHSSPLHTLPHSLLVTIILTTNINNLSKTYCRLSTTFIFSHALSHVTSPTLWDRYCHYPPYKKLRTQKVNFSHSHTASKQPTTIQTQKVRPQSPCS